MILVNFKIYKETFGEGAIKLARICKKVAEESGMQIIPVVSALDAYRISKEVGIEVFLQNINEFSDGAKTGNISPLQAKELGIKGSLINHSENKTKSGTIRKIIKNLPKDFKSVVCFHSLGQADTWLKTIKPDIIAYEPSYLIGNREKSVSSEQPDVIKKIVEKFPSIPVLVGAGIHSAEDVRIALKLGAKGILVSSDIVKAIDPEKELRKLTSGF